MQHVPRESKGFVHNEGSWFCCSSKGTSKSDSMFERKRVKCWAALTFCVFVVGVVYLGYFCPERNCAFSSSSKPTPISASTHSYEQEHSRSPFYSSSPKQNPICDTDDVTHDTDYTKNSQGRVANQNKTYSVLERNYRFDIDGDQDVIVYLHIQKTGGTTFGRHLVKNLRLSKPCICYRKRKKCDCENHNNHIWLFSRYSTGWRCGLHADWTELTACANSMMNNLDQEVRYRRFLYITILRDPYKRYLSEYKHVQRGATWQAARLQCDGKQASLQEVPFCFKGKDWSGVLLDEFLACPHNLASNRQTRMIANLSLSGCYDPTAFTKQQRDCIMLRSAKENLRNMAFFGLTEYQLETQYMFERTFGLEFIEDFFQYNHTHATQLKVSEEQRHTILELNELDIELYRYAKELFFHRLKIMKKEDIESRSGGLGERGNRHANEDYLEADENFTEDDDIYNQRINEGTVQVSKRELQSNHNRKFYDGDKPEKRRHKEKTRRH